MMPNDDITPDYPYETLSYCGVTGKPARFACIPLPGNDSAKFWFATFPYQENYNLSEIFAHFHDPVVEMINRSENLVAEYPIPQYGILNPSKDNMVLIGDAWHASSVGHSLAQGTSVGIEDAWELAQSFPDLDAFAQRRKTRINNYRFSSHFTKVLSDVDGVGLGPVRDLMRFVPNPINSMVFDYSLKYSLGGSKYIL